VLVAGNTDPGWIDKIDLFGKTYHPQIIASLSQATYTEAATMEDFGMSWANITTFSQDQPGSAVSIPQRLRWIIRASTRQLPRLGRAGYGDSQSLISSLQ
jgi:hypothetical protein